MKKGSITIFSLLSMILVASALLALLEAGRFHEIRHFTQLQTQVALESVFAEYNTYLWEEYGLLACKQDEVVGKLKVYGNNRIIQDNFATNFYQFKVEQVELEGYTRLTDGDGSAFIKAGADYMERTILYESAREIYNQYESIKKIQDESGFDFKDVEKALKSLEDSKKSVGTTGKETGVSNSGEMEIENESFYGAGENPLKIMQEIQKKGLLSLVVEDTSQLSGQEMNLTNSVSNRQLPEVFHPTLEEVDWYDRVLFQQYLLSYMSNYRDQKEHVWKYEVEYLLGGRNTEIENLKVVINQLLVMREAANFLYLSGNPTRVEQARLLAVAIVGASLNPVLVELVKSAVLAAWAFAESVLDIRTLLTGGRIALIKSEASWTLDLDYITTINEGFSKAKECKNGLNYKDYLGILLLLKQETTLAKRAMDMQEITIQERYGNTSIRMEEWIVDVKALVTYKYKPVFSSIHRVIPSWNYEIVTKETYGYGKR